MKRDSAVNTILKRIRGNGRGYVFAPADFLDLTTRASVDQALARLTKRGVIRRLKRGLYDYPRTSPRLGLLMPSPDQVGAVLARVTGVAVRPSAAQMANALGLTTQVPARTVLETLGISRRLKLGSQVLTIRHRTPRVMSARASVADDVLRALIFLGPDGATDQNVSQLAARLTPRTRQALARSKRRVPAWLHPTIDTIVREVK